MKYVVDSNFLQSKELREFLSKSRSNTAVLTDYAAMEAYKGDTLKSIFRSMEIPAEYPEQIIVLKNTRMVGALSGRTRGLQKRLVDKDQTKIFPQYCLDLKAAQAGDPRLTAKLLEYGREASEHMRIMLADMRGMVDAYKGIEETYTEDEIREFRTDNPYSHSTLERLLDHIGVQTHEFMKRHPYGIKIPQKQELPNTFLFRFSVCTNLLLIRWVRDGSNPTINTSKLRNDIVDANFAAFATYFDGLLSKDIKANDIHTEARYVLHLLGAAVSNPFEN